jgi:hypothetical protein
MQAMLRMQLATMAKRADRAVAPPTTPIAGTNQGHLMALLLLLLLLLVTLLLKGTA